MHFKKYFQGSFTVRVECGTHVFTCFLIVDVNHIDLHFYYRPKYSVAKLIIPILGKQ
jgi:hypothetical protein